MKTICVLLALLFSGGHLLFAQQVRFITSGRIEFEKTVNTYALIRNGELLGKNTAGNEQQLLEQYQKILPQMKILKSNLSFRDNKTLFVPAGVEIPIGGFPEIPMAAQNNIVYTDLPAGKMVIQKAIFEQAFLLKDSVRKIQWKITDETREIAGYHCRRANALIMDSIYVVAFYCERIPVAGGPESFSGLPGMILELALPHEHVSWRATKVTDAVISPDSVVPPKIGKPVDYPQLLKILSEWVKSRDVRAANIILKNSLL